MIEYKIIKTTENYADSKKIRMIIIIIMKMIIMLKKVTITVQEFRNHHIQ